MNRKENKGGELTNEQIEKDLQVKGTTEQPGGYNGSQDTGIHTALAEPAKEAKKETEDRE